MKSVCLLVILGCLTVSVPSFASVRLCQGEGQNPHNNLMTSTDGEQVRIEGAWVFDPVLAEMMGMELDGRPNERVIRFAVDSSAARHLSLPGRWANLCAYTVGYMTGLDGDKVSSPFALVESDGNMNLVWSAKGRLGGIKATMAPSTNRAGDRLFLGGDFEPYVGPYKRQ